MKGVDILDVNFDEDIIITSESVKKTNKNLKIICRLKFILMINPNLNLKRN